MFSLICKSMNICHIRVNKSLELYVIIDLKELKGVHLRPLVSLRRDFRCSSSLSHNTVERWQETDTSSSSKFRCLTCTKTSFSRSKLRSSQEKRTLQGQTVMASVTKDDRLTRTQSFMCAGFAGVFSKTVTSPLEVVKIKSQIGTFHCKRGFWQSFLLIYQNEGLRGLWKGNLASCLRLFPYTAVHLSTYKKIVHLHMDELGFISQWRAILAGGLAGVAAALVTYPLEVAETRLVVQNCRQPTYIGVFYTLSKIHRSEGLLALYRGFSLTLLGAFPFSLGCYAVYVSLDKLWQEPSFRFTPLQNFINGCLAVGVAQTLSYPFETVKRKMQAQSPRLPHFGGVDVHFSGMIDCFIQVVKSKGVLSLWNGLTANTIKIIPYFGLLFTCFEMCKQVCLYRNGYILSPLSYKLAPGVDQSLGPYELEEVKRYLKKRNFGSAESSLGSRW